MNALTLTQPYASLIALGEKRVETRSYRAPAGAVGKPLAIHAARRTEESEEGCIALVATLERLGIASADGLPYGAIVAVARLDASTRMPETIRGMTVFGGLPLTDQERALGHWAPGRYGWTLVEVVALPEPVPCRGMQGVWPVPAAVADRVGAVVASQRPTLPGHAPTPDQLKYVADIQRRLHLPDALLDNHAVATFGKRFAELDRREVSRLLDAMIGWEQLPAELARARGQLDLFEVGP